MRDNSSRTIFALNSFIFKNQFLVSFHCLHLRHDDYCLLIKKKTKNIYFVCFCPRIQMKCHIIFELIYYELVYFEYIYYIYFFLLCLRCLNTCHYCDKVFGFLFVFFGLLCRFYCFLASQRIKK